MKSARKRLLLCALPVFSLFARGQCTSQALQVAQQQLYKTIGYIGTSQFPLATVPPANHWGFNGPADDWNGGFFPGWIWYMYEQTLDSSLLARAQSQTASLGSDATIAASPLGYWMMPSFGNGYAVTRNPSYMQTIQTAAASLAKLYVPSAGVLNTVSSQHAGTENNLIDDVPGLELLFYAAQNGGNSAWYNMALSHALKAAQNNVRSDGSTYQGVEYNSDGSVFGFFTSNGAGTNSTWSRGQAFGIYGFTMAYRYTHNAALLTAAQTVADYFIANLPPDFVPPWDYTHTSPKDSSAAAIAAAGLIELATYTTDATKQLSYSNNALSIQSFLSNPTFYLGDPTTTDGILLHGAYYVPGNLDMDNSLIWGDYYFVQGCYRAMGLPPQVAGLTAGNVSSSQVPLSWQAQSGAVRYNVKRSSISGGPYMYLAPPPVLTTNSFTDGSVAASNTYYYVVSASTVAGEGPNSTELVVTAPSGPADFSLSDLPTSLSVSQAGSATSTISVAGSGGFAGSVGLSATSSAGLKASFNPPAINAGGSSVMTVTAAGVAAGAYTLTITGTSGTLVHSMSMTVTVTPGGSFTLSANPPALTLKRGTTAVSSIKATAANGFAGVVVLSAGGLPAGVSATISPSKVTAGGAGATLSLKTNSRSVPGSYTIQVTGTSSGVPQFVLKVPVQITR
jgi:hypothetical protein